MFYVIEGGVVVSSSETRPLTLSDIVELDETLSIGSKRIDGVFETSIISNEEISAIRDSAYSNIHTGSDKHFQEAAVKRAMSDEAGALEAESFGLERRAEIQAEYPFND